MISHQFPERFFVEGVCCLFWTPAGVGHTDEDDTHTHTAQIFHHTVIDCFYHTYCMIQLGEEHISPQNEILALRKLLLLLLLPEPYRLVSRFYQLNEQSTA